MQRNTSGHGPDLRRNRLRRSTEPFLVKTDKPATTTAYKRIASIL